MTDIGKGSKEIGEDVQVDLLDGPLVIDSHTSVNRAELDPCVMADMASSSMIKGKRDSWRAKEGHIRPCKRP
jgi:hypothetical protein